MSSSILEYLDINGEIRTKNIFLDKVEINRENLDVIMKCYNLSMGIYDNDYTSVFDYIIKQIVSITNSEIGAICEKIITQTEDYLKFLSMSEDKIKFPKNEQFHASNLNNLLGRGVKHNVSVISNRVDKDPRSSKLPKNHFKISKFMSIPLIMNEICMGQIILANKLQDYSEKDIYNIYHIVKLCTDTIFTIHYKKKYTLSDMLQTKSDVKKAKDDFLATMSHEIRTPLTGIMGAVTLLPSSGPLNDKQKSHLKIATTCSVQLLELINGILDFSRLTSNTLTLSKEPFDIKQCIEDSLDVIRPKISAKNLKMIINIDKNIPLMIIGDKKRLRQILINLLSNAVKFTDLGYIKLSVNAKKNLDDMSYKIAFEIEDSGIGIENEDKHKIFKMFSRLENQNAYNKRDGAGLGLAISKELITLMGGDIFVDSKGTGKGCKFSFYINAEENINIEKMLERFKGELKDLMILNVDDKTDNLLILDDLLYRWGIKSIMCISAEQALRYLNKGMKFDVCIIDIFMPYMSGIELAQNIRELYPDIPLIGISSVGEETQGKEWFDVYLSKPYNQNAILKSIVFCLTKEKNQMLTNKISFETIPKMKKTKDTLKILLAEDDESAQFMVREMILILGYNQKNITVVKNGQEAIDAVKNSYYDVCLMDIKMPIMDGLEASKHIRQMKIRPSLIAMSAGVLDEDKNTYLNGGMDGYLAKPFSTKELDTILKQFI